MKVFVFILTLFALISMPACTGSGSSDDYFAPGITVVPTELVASLGSSGSRGNISTIDTYAFGTVVSDTDATLTLHNIGDFKAEITNTYFGSSMFTFIGGSFPGAGGTCSRAISANGSCTITIRYSPTPDTSVSALMGIFYLSRDGETTLWVRLTGAGGVAPTISSVSPTAGPLAGGTTLTLQGTNFESGMTVTAGGSACTNISVISATQLSCRTPAHAAGAVDIVVTNTLGQRATYSNGFTYQAAPTITSVTPNAGALAGGTSITLTGTGFLNSASVLLNGSSCTSVNVISSTQITCTTPARSAGAVDVIIANTDGQTGALTTGYTYQAAPTVTSVSPNAGALAGGTAVTITGTGFLSGATVNFSGSSCGSVNVASATTITCTTSAHSAGLIAVAITNADTQSGTAAAAYTYQAAPTVTSLSPDAGALAGGTAVTITGTGFLSGASVDFGGSSCGSVSVASATQITCTTSAHSAGAVTVTVTNSDTQLGTKASGYTYQAAPSITTVTPSAGALAGGTAITITGTGFLSGAGVAVGGSNCSSISVVNATTITCSTPAHSAGLVNVIVTNSDSQTDTETNAFTYQAAPTVTSSSPNSGTTAGSTAIAITGTGFLSGATVTVGGSACTSVSVDSATQISCTTPAGSAGAVNIVVTNSDSQNGTGTGVYTYTAGGIESWTATTTTGAPSGRYLHTAVWSGSKMIIWGGVDAGSALRTGGLYDPVDDSWSSTTTTNAPTARYGHAAVWTGSKMVVYGGSTVDTTGGAYDPVSNSWTATSGGSAPAGKLYLTAVWTGSKMAIWGGFSGVSSYQTGGLYDPGNDSWSTITTTGAPSGRGWHSAVWTGKHMIIWGGDTCAGSNCHTNTGGKYDPATDAWTSTSTTSAPTARAIHTAIWTGSKMIVWSGRQSNTNNPTNSGGVYNASADTWTSMTTTGAPPARDYASAIWTGAKMIIWGGWAAFSGGAQNTGGLYDPFQDTWATTTTSGAPSARYRQSGIWTGSEMVVWGGYETLNSGGVYTPPADPASNTWTATTTTSAPSARAIGTATWTGSKMIIWGGQTGVPTNTGALYDPVADSWTATTTTSAPDARHSHVAVWTGSKMVVWGGGNNIGGYHSTGGLYDPVLDQWTTTTNTGAPAIGGYPTSVWTGSKMIVWGGGGINLGGLYDPANDTWTSTTTTGAPQGRMNHTAVWTGSKMIIWGGSAAPALNTGGVYDPALDSWTATTTSSAPAARYTHVAVWTGSKMIIWGGSTGAYTNTGGLYDPNTDTWTAMTTTSAPEGRVYNCAPAWTGSKMIVWGGYGNSDSTLDSGGLYDPIADTWTATTTTGAPEGRNQHMCGWTGAKFIVWGGTNGSVLNTGGVYTP